MGKFDAVDRMMAQAAEPVRHAGEATTPEQPAREAEAVLEAKVSAAEPVLSTRGRSLPAIAPVAPTRVLPLLQALRPLLPALGGALNFVDHGAVRAVAKLLPLLSAATGAGGARAAGSSVASTEAETLRQELVSLRKQQAGMNTALDAQKAELGTLEEQARRMRDTGNRLATEQQTIVRRMDQLTDRVRLLSAAVVILVLLVIAEMVLLFVFRRA